MRSLVFLPAVCILFWGCRQNSTNAGAGPSTYPHKIVVSSSMGLGFELEEPSFADIIDTLSAIELLAGGFTWSEGPVWVPEAGRLLFTDVPANVVYRFNPGTISPRSDGVWGVDTFLYPAGFLDDPAIPGEAGANGLIVDKNGQLLLAQHGERQVALLNQNLAQAIATGRLFPDSTSFRAVAKTYHGRRFNSPNDLVQSKKGDIYFTDPPYGLEKTFGDSARQLAFSGVYRINTRDSNRVTLLYDQLDRPNGIVLTPDEDALIVSNSQAERTVWMRCPLNKSSDTSKLECKVFADVTSLVGPDNPGSADGMVMLPNGVLLATGPGGVLVFDAGGELLGTIRTGRATANVTVGGRDGRDIFITADDLLLQARLKEGL